MSEHSTDRSLEGKSVLVTGGTGSLGRSLVRRILSGQYGCPSLVTVFSRDEAKQYQMRLDFRNLAAATEEVIYTDAERLLHFRIGDIRDFNALSSVMRDTDVVFNAAALKQVPSCEYHPDEAVATNISGVSNIVNCIRHLNLPVETVVGVSTDKACKPVNVMGLTKAIQERMLTSANLLVRNTRFAVVRYGNVLASRGSVIPLFHSQIRAGGPVTITTRGMTRFLLSLDQAVDAIMATYIHARTGEVFIPRLPSSRLTDIAEALIGDLPIEIVEKGIRPGEKTHEILVSEEETQRTYEQHGYYCIRPIIPDLIEDGTPDDVALSGEYSSATDLLSRDETAELLRVNGLMLADQPDFRQLFSAP